MWKHFFDGFNLIHAALLVLAAAALSILGTDSLLASQVYPRYGSDRIRHFNLGGVCPARGRSS